MLDHGVQLLHELWLVIFFLFIFFVYLRFAAGAVDVCEAAVTLDASFGSYAWENFRGALLAVRPQCRLPIYVLCYLRRAGHI